MGVPCTPGRMHPKNESDHPGLMAITRCLSPDACHTMPFAVARRNILTGGRTQPALSTAQLSVNAHHCWGVSTQPYFTFNVSMDKLDTNCILWECLWP